MSNKTFTSKQFHLLGNRLHSTHILVLLGEYPGLLVHHPDVVDGVVHALQRDARHEETDVEQHRRSVVLCEPI